MTPAGKLNIIQELLGKKEVHTCDHCDETHVHETPALITPEQALELLNSTGEEE